METLEWTNGQDRSLVADHLGTFPPAEAAQFTEAARCLHRWRLQQRAPRQ